MSGKAAQKPSETPSAENGDAGSGEAGHISKLMPTTILDLADKLGALDLAGDLVPEEGEHEVDFAVRVLPQIGDHVGGVIAALIEERDALKRQLSSQKGAATKARNAIEEMKEASRPRRIGVMDMPEGEGGKPFTALELKAAIDAAEEVVLAFSDGKVEIKGIAPRKVDPRDFKLVRGRLLFDRADLTISGPGGDVPVPHLAGVALLLDGEQFAWSPMAQPIDVGAGQTINLAGSVIFG